MDTKHGITEVLDTTYAPATLYHLQRSPNFAKRFVDECLLRQWDKWELCLLVSGFPVASSILPLITALLTPDAAAVVSFETCSLENMLPKFGIRAAMKNGRRPSAKMQFSVLKVRLWYYKQVLRIK